MSAVLIPVPDRVVLLPHWGFYELGIAPTTPKPLTLKDPKELAKRADAIIGSVTEKMDRSRRTDLEEEFAMIIEQMDSVLAGTYATRLRKAIQDEDRSEVRVRLMRFYVSLLRKLDAPVVENESNEWIKAMLDELDQARYSGEETTGKMYVMTLRSLGANLAEGQARKLLEPRTGEKLKSRYSTRSYYNYAFVQCLDKMEKPIKDIYMNEFVDIIVSESSSLDLSYFVEAYLALASKRSPSGTDYSDKVGEKLLSRQI